MRLAPMVFRAGAMAAVSDIQPAMDLWDVDSLDQFNRDYTSIADSGFGKVTQNGADYQARFRNQADNLSLSVVKRTDMTTITEDLVDGNKYREIQGMLLNLGGGLFRTRCRDASQVGFTFSGSSSFTDAEGNPVSNGIAKGSEPIFDDTHGMADGSNLDNELADTPIGEVSTRNLEDLTIDFPDENGETVSWGLGGKVLVTSVDKQMEYAALRLTTQPWNFASAQRDLNPFSDAQARGGAFTHVPLFYLASTAQGKRDSTKDKYYFVIDRKIAKQTMIFGDHTPPTLLSPLTDIYNRGVIHAAKSRYDLGVQAAHHGAACFATA